MILNILTLRASFCKDFNHLYSRKTFIDSQCAFRNAIKQLRTLDTDWYFIDKYLSFVFKQEYHLHAPGYHNCQNPNRVDIF